MVSSQQGKCAELVVTVPLTEYCRSQELLAREDARLGPSIERAIIPYLLPGIVIAKECYCNSNSNLASPCLVIAL